MQNLTTWNVIENIITFIEDNIKENIKLDDISNQVHISKYHLHRLFKNITSKSIMEYVRKRKLTCSIEEILNSNKKIIDIALEYNFQCEKAYIRSFKKLFGVSPGRLRRSKKELDLVEKIDMNIIKAINLGIIIEPNFLIKPEFYLIGISNKIFFEDNTENFTANVVGRDFFYNHRHKIKNKKFENVYIGFSTFCGYDLDYSLYLTSSEVTDTDFIPEEMTLQVVPTKKYAVFKYISLCSADEITLLDLENIYVYIYKEWLPNSCYYKLDNFHFERIDNSLSTEDYCEVEIYIPIVDKF